MQALTERFEMRLDQETLHAVDAWRSRQGGVPSRAEAIRQLIERALSDTAPPERPQLTFSPGETLMIHMLCDLFKAQKIKSDIRPEFVQDALYGGHLWGLEWDMQGVFHTHLDRPDRVTAVVNILDMWDFIESGYENLTAKEKTALEVAAAPFGKNPKFTGFDGNNETEYMGIARFFIQKMKRFSRFKSRGDLNSHFPTLEMHARMLAVFEPIRATLHGTDLSADQLIKILKARTHPSRAKPSDDADA